MSNSIEQLVSISNSLGAKPDHIQGAGGNFSLKIGNNLIVKASGSILGEVTIKSGLAKVDLAFFSEGLKSLKSLNLSDLAKEEELAKLNLRASRPLDKVIFRPSMETAFHAFLQHKAILHTHSVYAQLLTCSENGELLAQTLLKDAEFDWVWVPYGNPGFGLFIKIEEAINTYLLKTGRQPKVFLLESHGLIIQDSDLTTAQNLYQRFHYFLTEKIRFSEFPSFTLTASRNYYLLNSGRFNQLINSYLPSLFDVTILCPDQSIILKDKRDKVSFQSDFQLKILATSREAQAIAEMVIACTYLLHNLDNQGLKPNRLSSDKLSLLHEISTEQFRKSQLSL